MKKILLFGAGKSASCLIRYLIGETALRGWRLVVAESNLLLARSKVGDAAHVEAVQADVQNSAEREALIRDADIVISLLPPALHILVAQSCIVGKKHLLTASYLDAAIRALEPAIDHAGLLFICEMGLDPGIDHMSAMELIHRIKGQGGRITSFRSHTGGLVAPESDDNPWHYKISWNPRNVVLAGSAGARYREDRVVVTRAYGDLFDQCAEVDIEGIGSLAWYPNRDSLSYIPLYGLETTATFIRTTLRYPAFCRAWKSIVRAGLTDDAAQLRAAGGSLAEWSAPLLPYIDDSNRAAFEYLGLLDEGPVPAGARHSADILQYLLETRLVMQPEDRDMIVMLHEIAYETAEGPQEIRSSLIVKGEDAVQTAMAKTVGLPLGIAALLILEEKISLRGLHIPISPGIYEPVLKALAGQGIAFTERMLN